MSGTYRHLVPGRYHLEVESGAGPAGVRRPDGEDIVIDVNGGERTFALSHGERVYFWWRGPTRRPGVRLTPPQERERAGREGSPNRRPALLTTG